MGRPLHRAAAVARALSRRARRRSWGAARSVGAGWWLAVALGACRAPAASVVDRFDVRVPVGTAGGELVLAGTLTVPSRSDGTRAPVALILGGSGPQNRDGARDDLPGYQPWQEVADSLAGRGIASLRLDDRGTAASTGQFAGSTTVDFAHDAEAAVRWLQTAPSVDGTRLALIGHSEGALVALLAAPALPPVRALVLLGAASRPGRELARWQRQAVVTRDLAAFPPPMRTPVLSAAEGEAERLAEREPWLRTWFALDPRDAARTAARTTHAPVLLVHGETDQQVPVAQAAELAAALREGGARVRVERVPRTNHLFLADDDGGPEGYVRLVDRRVHPAALGAIAGFLEGALGAR
ncbi:MAG: alpha/beta fold hydrolase [Gemmatimonadaceae bacterium]|nr:alpha/beta fold hydrolase [Gemmatimonadaceae bacterium]